MKSLSIPLFLLLFFTLGQRRADQLNKTSKVTFTTPIQVPGGVLGPGTYTFKLVGGDSDRHVVQIFSENGTRLIQSISTIPNWNVLGSGEILLLYRERPSGQAQAVEAWISPGSNFGEVFIYQKSQALELSRLNNTIVPSYEEEDGSKKVELSSTAGKSSIATTAAPPTQSNRLKGLPHTASEVPLMGILGFALLMTAMGLRVFVGERPMASKCRTEYQSVRALGQRGDRK